MARWSAFGVVLLLSMIAVASLRGESNAQLSDRKTNQPRRIKTASNRTGVVRAQSDRLTSSRSLADVDGKTACSDCSGSSKCVGRTIEDAQCDACSKGQVSRRDDSSANNTLSSQEVELVPVQLGQRMLVLGHDRSSRSWRRTQHGHWCVAYIIILGPRQRC